MTDPALQHALTGLMFVVVSINPETVAERPETGVRAFVTPTMAFFTTALVVSALLLAPHIAARSLAVLLAVTGIAGIAYLVWVRGHHHWVHGLDGQPPNLPYASYLLLIVAAVGFWMRAGFAAPTLGFTTVLLLVVGIHNAWDLVIWLSQKRRAS